MTDGLDGGPRANERWTDQHETDQNNCDSEDREDR